jgi:pyrroloquinoline-quinone synthase
MNAKDESDHVAPWVRFASAIGIAPEELASYGGDQKANAAVEMMKKLSLAPFEEAVAAMYAYEAELPKISRTKLDGLKKFYQLDSKDAMEYFQIHEEADVRHAQVWREILQAIPENRQEAVFNAAVESLVAQNLLLDSVQEKYVR